jgi:hypothetical protein
LICRVAIRRSFWAMSYGGYALYVAVADIGR